MKRARLIGMVASSAAIALFSASSARATDYTWNVAGGGAQAWDNPANWTPSGFPNASTDTGNLSIGLTGDLLLNLPAGGISMGNLSLGGTGSAVKTDIGNANSSGGILTLVNTTPYKATVVNVVINSGGTAGDTNIISAPIRLTAPDVVDPVFEVTGTNSLTLSGALTSFGSNTTLDATERTLKNDLTSGVLDITGGIFLSDAADTEGAPTTGRRLLLAGTGTTIIDSQINDGPLPHASVTGSTGPLNFGTNSATDPVGTIIINSDNRATFTGEVVQNRSILVLGNDGALGTNRLRQGNPSGRFGFDIQSTDDARNIANEIRINQFMTISGDHSINFSGLIAQGNGRAMVNLLPEGKTLTLSGTVDTANSSDNRFFDFDGTGQTVVSAAIHDTTTGNTAEGSIQKLGTGTTLVNGTASDYTGLTVSSGGLLQLANAQAYGAGSATGGSSGMVANPGGAISLQTGSLDLNFLNLFQASFDYMKTGNEILSYGGLALTNLDAASNIDYTTGPLAQSHLANLSIGADGNINYTGTITPNATIGYRLGGGGTLTLANANALTGANNVTVTNGGAVVVPNLNNYTGTTTIRAEYITTNTQRAVTKDSTQPNVQFESTTLQAAHLGNGGSPSSIGSSSSDASNLVLQGGALEYTGAGDSTDRQFTIGTYGGELDASGSGAVTFTSTTPAVLADAAPRTGDVNFSVNRNQIQNVPDVSDIVIGMPISGTGIADGATIAAILDEHTLQMSTNAAATQAGTTVTFGTVPRTFTLGGSNTAGNTLAAGLADSTGGGVLNLAKNGSGTWSLSGPLSYTGSTTVNAGTLSLATNLTTSSGVTVTGGTLQLAPGGGSNRVIVSPTPTISGSGKIDLADNKMVVTTAGATGAWTGTAYDGVSGMVQSARGNGSWNGTTGITSSSAASNANPKLFSIGVVKVGDLHAGLADTDTTTFAGQTVHGSDTIAMYTYGGDANLDGKINIDDYGLIDSHVGQSGTAFGWHNGDFNYDGKINIDDYGIIDGNIGAQGAPIPASAQGLALAGGVSLGGVSAVPEPASMGLLAILGAGLLARRRRQA